MVCPRGGEDRVSREPKTLSRRDAVRRDEAAYRRLPGGNQGKDFHRVQDQGDTQAAFGFVFRSSRAGKKKTGLAGGAWNKKSSQTQIVMETMGHPICCRKRSRTP